MLAANKVPEEGKEAPIPVFRTGNRTICKNYSGVSLLNNGYKMFAKMLT
jgi:hypothetical protein